jgi:hypothetical protein
MTNFLERLFILYAKFIIDPDPIQMDEDSVKVLLSLIPFCETEFIVKVIYVILRFSLNWLDNVPDILHNRS